MGDDLPEAPDLPSLLRQPPLQPLDLLPGHRKMEGASQPRPQAGLAPGEVVVLTLTICLGLVTIGLIMRLMTIGLEMVTISLEWLMTLGLGLMTGSSCQPLLPVTSPGEPDHGPPESLELVLIRGPGVTRARSAGFITPRLARAQ